MARGRHCPAAPAHGGQDAAPRARSTTSGQHGRAVNPLPVCISGKAAPHLKHKLFSASESQTEPNGFEALGGEGMGWAREANPGAFLAACLTELILTREQDFLACWTPEASGTRRGTSTLAQLGTN